MFSKLCNELGLEHSSYLLHTIVRWLSREKIVERVFELREELLIFLKEHNADLASLVANEIWLGLPTWQTCLIFSTNKTCHFMEEMPTFCLVKTK